MHSWEAGQRHAVLIGVVVLAILVHLPIFGNALNPDTTAYMQYAQSLVTGGSLEVTGSPVARHPPLMALLFVPFAVLFGFNEFAVHLLQMTFFVLDLLVVYAMALRWGRCASLVASLLLVVDPIVYLSMSEGRAVTLLILFALVTLWGIWRGLDDSRWLIVAAVGASLGFLTADTVGYLFVVAGGIGFLWRFYYMRWRVLTDWGYLAAAAIFLGVVAAWTAYNLAATGSPYTDPRVVGYLDRLVLSTPAFVTVVTVGGLVVYFLLFLSQSFVGFLLFREGRQRLGSLPRRAIQDQKAGAMVLFLLVTSGIAATVSAAFLLYEPLRSLSTVDSYLRYVDIVAPMVYLAIGGHVQRVSLQAKPVRWALPLAIALVLLSAQMVAKVSQGQRNTDTFVEIRDLLEQRGYRTVYTDVVDFLRYNVPRVTFISVYEGVTSPYVNLTAEIPPGATVLTLIYVPRTYDAAIGAFYLVNHFDPSTNSPFADLGYSPG